MKVVFDTNVLVSATLFGGTPRRSIRAVVEAFGTIVTSPRLLDELEHTLVGRFALTPAAAATIREAVEREAQVVRPREVPKVARDPDDDHVIAAAVTGAADTICTGDRDLLTLGTFQGIRILRPADLLAQLG